jgi:hypothetical protein
MLEIIALVRCVIYLRNTTPCSIFFSKWGTPASASIDAYGLFWTGASDILNVKLPNLLPVTWAADILTEAWWSTEERAKVITVMWSIRSSSNRWMHGEKGFDPAIAVEAVRDKLLELQLLNQMFPRLGFNQRVSGID